MVSYNSHLIDLPGVLLQRLPPKFSTQFRQWEMITTPSLKKTKWFLSSEARVRDEEGVILVGWDGVHNENA